MSEKAYVLKWSNQDVWIADWEGDPGRTLKIENAKVFKSKIVSQKEISVLKKKNQHRKMNLIVEMVA